MLGSGGSYGKFREKTDPGPVLTFDKRHRISVAKNGKNWQFGAVKIEML